MRSVFDEVIVPCAQRFKPDIVLVSAGSVSLSFTVLLAIFWLQEAKKMILFRKAKVKNASTE